MAFPEIIPLTDQFNFVRYYDVFDIQQVKGTQILASCQLKKHDIIDKPYFVMERCFSEDDNLIPIMFNGLIRLQYPLVVRNDLLRKYQSYLSNFVISSITIKTGQIKTPSSKRLNTHSVYMIGE